MDTNVYIAADQNTNLPSRKGRDHIMLRMSEAYADLHYCKYLLFCVINGKSVGMLNAIAYVLNFHLLNPLLVNVQRGLKQILFYFSHFPRSNTKSSSSST